MACPECSSGTAPPTSAGLATTMGTTKDYYYYYNVHTKSTTAFGQTTTHGCDDWCAEKLDKTWEQKCTWVDCAACSECNGEPLFSPFVYAYIR